MTDPEKVWRRVMVLPSVERMRIFYRRFRPGKDYFAEGATSGKLMPRMLVPGVAYSTPTSPARGSRPGRPKPRETSRLFSAHRLDAHLHSDVKLIGVFNLAPNLLMVTIWAVSLKGT